MTLRVGLGHHGQLLALARASELKRVANDSRDPDSRHHRDIGGHFYRVTLVRASAHTSVFALRILSHDDPVKAAGFAMAQGTHNPRQYTGGTHISVLIKTLTDL